MRQRSRGWLLALALGSVSVEAAAQQVQAVGKSWGNRSAATRPTSEAGSQKQALRSQAADLEAQRRSTLARLDRSLAETQQAENALRAVQQLVARGAAPRSRLRPLELRVTRGRASVDTARRQLAQNTYQLARLRTQLQQGEGRSYQSSLLLRSVADRGAATAPGSQNTAGGSVSLPSAGGGLSSHNPVVTPAAQVGSAWEGMLAHAETEVRRATANLRTTEARLIAAEEKLSNRKRMVQEGLAPTSELPQVEADVVSAKAAFESDRYQLAQQQQHRLKASRLVTLQRPIDVELRNASVRDAALSIYHASGMAVEVDPIVSRETRLTVVARGVPMATILDSIARQSGLLIHPDENGIVLKPAPSLEVNGERTDFISPFAPWSSEWGTNPSASMSPGGYHTQAGNSLLNSLQNAGTNPRVRVQSTPPLQGEGSRLAPNGIPGATPPTASASGAPSGAASVAPAPIAPPATSVVQEPGYPPTARSPAPNLWVYPDGQGRLVYEPMPGGRLRVLTPAGEPGPVAVTALGETSFVVAHPSTAPGGEPAVMLTVYRLEGSQLRRVSSTLHRLGTGAGQRGDAPSIPQERDQVRPRSSTPAIVLPREENLPKPSQPRDTPAAR
jgi:hypothetical protein